MKDFESLIKKTEEKYLDVLYSEVRNIFANDLIPSHNEFHHLRVWKYAVQLTRELWDKGIKIESAELENLMIAVFFHDTGLVSVSGPEHGKASSILCKKWLEKQSLSAKTDSDTILNAIEHHENKEYTENIPLISEGRINLSGVLGICDDLDAFGYCGIFRYAEIYLMRNTPMEELGQKVLSNVSVRFGNFLRQCAQFPKLIKIHTLRFGITEQFFKQYNAQLHKDSKGLSIIFGPYAITRFIYKQLSGENYTVDNLCKRGIAEAKSPYDREFYENLRHDWYS